MIKKSLMTLCILVCAHLQLIADDNDYRIICTNIVAALSHGRVLTSPSFTNQLHAYAASTNVRVQTLAKLVLSDALLTMYDKSSDFMAYDEGFVSVSNVLFSSELPTRSWQKSVASLFYAWALRIDGKKDMALSVCCTALSSHLASPTTDVECAVWSAMSREDGLPEMSITNSLRLAASSTRFAIPLGNRATARTDQLPLLIALNPLKIANNCRLTCVYISSVSATSAIRKFSCSVEQLMEHKTMTNAEFK